MARIVESSSSFTMDVRTDANALGQLLAEAKTDMKRIFTDVLLRVAISALAVWVWSRKGDLTGAVNLVLYAGLLVFTAYPLIHLGDTLGFYENGVMFKKKTFLFRSRNGQWFYREGMLNVMQARYLILGGHQKKINASYVRDPQDAFSKAYRNYGLK